MIKNYKILATIEARTNSNRLPEKVLKKINNLTLLEILISRVKKSKYIDQIVVATTRNKNDMKISELSKKIDVNVYRGSENDVLQRLAKTAYKYDHDLIVQLTGDNPLIDPNIIDYMIEKFFKSKNINFLTNNGFGIFKNRKLPYGMDVHVFYRKDLIKINNKKLNATYREHPSLYFYKNPSNKFKILNASIPKKWQRKYKLRLTVDTIEDFLLIKKLYLALYKENKYFSLEDILNFVDKNKSVLNINKNINQKTLDEKKLKKI